MEIQLKTSKFTSFQNRQTGMVRQPALLRRAYRNPHRKRLQGQPGLMLYPRRQEHGFGSFKIRQCSLFKKDLTRILTSFPKYENPLTYSLQIINPLPPQRRARKKEMPFDLRPI